MPRHYRRRHRSGYYGRRGQPAILTPSSTPGCIVFPYDKKNRRFETSGYFPMQTQNRLSEAEVERYLNVINEPIAMWYKEYGGVYEGKGIYLCCLILTFYLFPLFCFYLCWLSSQRNEATKKLEEVKNRAREIVREECELFARKGLIWNIPQHFPQWIELWTSAGNGMPPPPMPFHMMPQGAGIPMLVVQQPRPVYPANYSGMNMGNNSGMGYSFQTQQNSEHSMMAYY